jgi:sugar O-acyltransferase (sialic acid O-acetyltransferase NeuD family)
MSTVDPRDSQRMAREVIVLGAGGTMREVLDLIDALNASGRSGQPLRCVGCLDDDPALQGTEVGGVPVLGPLLDAGRRYGHAMLVDALGSPRSFPLRAEAARRAASDPTRFLTLIHPTAVVSPRASVGHGALIFAGVVVGSGASIGDHVTILANSVVNHDARVGDHSILASGVTLSGGVMVGPASYVGAGSHVRQLVQVGAGALVGMGAVVVRDVTPGTVVAGNPARPKPSALP